MRLTLLFILALTTLACSKKKTTNATQSTFVSGSWIISSYIDDNKDKTAQYNGQEFKFYDDNIVEISGSQKNSGNYSISNETDDSSSEQHFILELPGYHESLSDDWHIKSISSEYIYLEDVSGGNGGTETLTFKKK